MKKTQTNNPVDQNLEFDKMALKYRFFYSMTGLFLGLVSMIGGIVLFLNGVAGSTSWTAKILGNESTISDAAPGAVLFLVGLFVVIATRYKVKTDTYSDKYGNNRVSRKYYKSPIKSRIMLWVG